MERVMEDVRRDTENARKAADEKRNLNGNAEKTGQNESGLAIPRVVEDEGVRVTRECLESVIEMTE